MLRAVIDQSHNSPSQPCKDRHGWAKTVTFQAVPFLYLERTLQLFSLVDRTATQLRLTTAHDTH